MRIFAWHGIKYARGLKANMKGLVLQKDIWMNLLFACMARNSGLDGIKRRHWLPWKDVQRPIIEGGLGIRSLWHIQLSMATKHLWNIYHSSSIWTHYARLLSHPTYGLPKIVFIIAKSSIIDSSRWILGRGDSVDFFHDLWTGNSPLRFMLADPDDAPHVTVREMLQNRSQPAWSLVPHMQKLSSIHLSEDHDTCIWTHSTDGLFNTRSAYDILRPRGIQRPALAKIWHCLFLRKASMFCWKVIHRVIPIKLVRWIPPVYGLCLNVDGASKGNPGLSGGGGCIRDSNGNICLAFAFHYGFGNSLQAEVRALHDGLMLANEFGLSINQIYSDSALLVQSFTNNSLPSWECARWWRPAFDTLRSLQTSCCHVFREANKVADALASYATSNHGNKIFTTFSSLPLACRGPATLDKTGLPYVRLG
ncbi:hypothetical protein Taro_052161 [Colocasia esculenta]|uniref:RNase H type-1 domain-containing protein n=1 Tax=Colocasia esculenta TaxID=4460 RepID=A0A843XIW7_COLES|nr:hypothetical protein [Colocasia esculenta]